MINNLIATFYMSVRCFIVVHLGFTGIMTTEILIGSAIPYFAWFAACPPVQFIVWCFCKIVQRLIAIAVASTFGIVSIGTFVEFAREWIEHWLPTTETTKRSGKNYDEFLKGMVTTICSTIKSEFMIGFVVMTIFLSASCLYGGLFCQIFAYCRGDRNPNQCTYCRFGIFVWAARIVWAFRFAIWSIDYAMRMIFHYSAEPLLWFDFVCLARIELRLVTL
jgi:hypothetical protein